MDAQECRSRMDKFIDTTDLSDETVRHLWEKKERKRKEKVERDIQRVIQKGKLIRMKYKRER